MSQITFTGPASGTGTVNISAPVTNTERNLTLPDMSGTITAASSGTADATTFLRGDGAWSVVEGTPAGSVIWYAANAAPTGFLKANGATVSRTTYASLFSAIGTTFGAGDGSTTFLVPDLRGEFLRGWDDARGIDSGRAFGSAQGDAIRNITGLSMAATHPSGAAGNPPSGAFYLSGHATVGSANTSPRGEGFDASLVVPTAAENRPRSIALLACIKF